MKKITMVLLSSMLLLAFGAGNALAEDTLETILTNHYGAVTYQEVLNTNEYEFDPGAYVVTALIVDHQAGYTDPTGWYDALSSTHPKTQLFPSPVAGQSQTFSAPGRFGIYIDSNAGTFYSKASLNSGSTKRARLFKINTAGPEPVYALGFEDLTDNDYNDVVLEIKGANLSIPEFPTVALPVAGVLGLLFVFGRKKEGL